MRLRLALAVLFSGSWCAPALAHGSERGFVLLLPTGHYLFGGAAAVAATFLLLVFLPGGWVKRMAGARLRLGSVPPINPMPARLASFLLLLLLLAAGLYGSRDPLRNPLPLTVWTVWWVGFPLLHALFGNLWAYLNPWSGPYRLLDRVGAGRLSRRRLRYPARLGYWPALVFFAGFAWLELVYPAPDDPERLAYAVGAYWAVAFDGMVMFGERESTVHAEPFSIFFRLIAGIAPLRSEPDAAGHHQISLAWPGAGLIAREPLPLSGALFLLLTLSSVSFDGLSKTFWWLGLGDINPLEFPGRSAVVGRNSAGLAVSFLALAGVTWAAVALGSRLLARPSRGTAPSLGALVLSLVPISLAFHVAHYLTALLVDGQYALLAAADPFGSGADLLGLGHIHVTTSFLNTYSGVRAIWNLQTAAIVLGHIVAILLAHAIALREVGDERHASLSQAPMAVLMVLYTLFGLWLLSTPVAG